MTVQLAQIFETTETPTKASVYLKRGGSNSGSAFDIDLPKTIDSTNFKTIEQGTHKLILSEDSQQTGDGVLSIEPFGPETSSTSGVLYPIVHYPVKTTNPGRFFVHMRVKSPSGNLQVSLLIDDVIIKEEAFSFSAGWTWIMMEFALADIDIHHLGIRLEENSSAIDKLYISDDNDPMSGNGPDFTDSPFITVHMQVYETDGVDTPTNPLKIYDFKNTIDEIAVDDWYNFNISVIDSSISVNFMGRFALVMSSSGGSDDNYVIWELVDNDEYVLLPSAIRI